ncbi:MAG: TlpA family protein disulfide reductase [Gemmatimonadaceae bacterium]|nr:TlpA family protein disulfide reductase [Gemmatimonadaceae bacterium]
MPDADTTPRPWWRPTWTRVLALVALAWALPRLVPHLGALAGIAARDAATPRYAVQALTGDSLSANMLRGRVVLVNVWATWCLPCRVEMPLLEQTWRRHRDAGLVVLGASVDRGDPAIVRRFVAERGISYPVAIVDRAMLDALGGVQGYPTSILIGRDGRVRHRVIGPIGPLTLEPAIRRALAEVSPTSTAMARYSRQR